MVAMLASAGSAPTAKEAVSVLRRPAAPQPAASVAAPAVPYTEAHTVNGQTAQVEMSTAQQGRPVQAAVQSAGASAASPPLPPSVAPPRESLPASKPDLAIGVAKGLPLEGIVTFVRSLAHFAPGTHIVLFVDAQPPAAGTSVQVDGYPDIPVDPHLDDVPNLRFELFDPAKLPAPWASYHPSNYRQYLYDEFLRKHAEEYDRILISDIRDAAFQLNPFEAIAPNAGPPLDTSASAPSPEPQNALHVFFEDNSMNIGRCGVNSGWIRNCFGGQELRRVSSSPISCSGFLLGRARAVAAYVGVMRQELQSHSYCQANGIDQGVHNVLVGRGLRGELPQITWVTHTNEHGPVMTAGYYSGPLELDAEGRLPNQDGKPYAVLHQYDRKPKLKHTLFSRWGKAGGGASPEPGPGSRVVSTQVIR